MLDEVRSDEGLREPVYSTWQPRQWLEDEWAAVESARATMRISLLFLDSFITDSVKKLWSDGTLKQICQCGREERRCCASLSGICKQNLNTCQTQGWQVQSSYRISLLSSMCLLARKKRQKRDDWFEPLSMRAIGRMMRPWCRVLFVGRHSSQVLRGI